MTFYQHIAIVLNGTLSARKGAIVYCNPKNSSSSSLEKFHGEKIYFADGGINKASLKLLSSKSWCWMGDRDSVAENRISFLTPEHSIFLNQEKNFSDFSAILETLLLLNKNLFIEVFAGFGKRRDHELINLFEAKEFFSKTNQKIILYFQPEVLLINTACSISMEKGSLFSIVSLSGGVVEVSGAKYEGAFQLERASHGLSNIASGGRVDIKPSGVFLIIL